MATTWTPTIICVNSPSKISLTNLVNSKVKLTLTSSISSSHLKFETSVDRRRSCTALRAGLTDIEPDLNEDPKDRWATSGVSPEDFEYGVYDEHHTFYESSDKGTFWGSMAEEYASVDPPTGFQGLISWLFLPAVAAAMYFNAPGEYLFIGAGLFVAIFCIIEMDKPDQPHNFEPQIYNMERGARDKLLSDYNTMDIWDFNEKYGELWDFTVKNDELVKK